MHTIKKCTYLQLDDVVKIVKSIKEKCEVSKISHAAEKYESVRKFLVRNKIEPAKANGLFMRIRKNASLNFPISVCFFMKHTQKQKITNVILCEENSQIIMESYCASQKNINEKHKEKTFIILKDGAKFSFVSLHAWKKTTSVKAKLFVKACKNSEFRKVLVVLKPAKKEKLKTKVVAKEHAHIFLTSLAVLPEGKLKIRETVNLSGKESTAEIITKGAVKEGFLSTYSKILAEAPLTKAHVECNGIMLGDGIISTTPALIAMHKDVSLTHEASIGKVSQEEIEYLRTRGLNKDEAIRLIVSGFMSTEQLPVPKSIVAEISKILSETSLF